MLGKYSEGETVVSNTGVPAKVKTICGDKAYVEYPSRVSGNLTETWCDKSILRKAEDDEEYYCGLCKKLMPISHFPHS